METHTPIFIIGIPNYVYNIAKNIISILTDLALKNQIKKKYEIYIFTSDKKELSTHFPVVLHIGSLPNYIEAKLQELTPPLIFFCDKDEKLYDFENIKNIIELANYAFTFDFKLYKLEKDTELLNLKDIFIRDITNFEIYSIIPKIDDLIYLLNKNDLYKLYIISTCTYSSTKIHKISSETGKKEYLINRINFLFIFNFFSSKFYDKIISHFNLFIETLIKNIQENKFPFDKIFYLDFYKIFLSNKNDAKLFLNLLQEIKRISETYYFDPVILIKPEYAQFIKMNFPSLNIFNFSYSHNNIMEDENINLLNLSGIVTEQNNKFVLGHLEQTILKLFQKSSIKPVIYLNLENLILLDKTIFSIINSIILLYQKLSKTQVASILVICPDDAVDKIKNSLSTIKVKIISNKEFEEQKAILYAKKFKL